MGVELFPQPPAQQQGRQQCSSLCDTSAPSPAAPAMLQPV